MSDQTRAEVYEAAARAWIADDGYEGPDNGAVDLVAHDPWRTAVDVAFQAGLRAALAATPGDGGGEWVTEYGVHYEFDEGEPYTDFGRHSRANRAAILDYAALRRSEGDNASVVSRRVWYGPVEPIDVEGQP